MNAIIDTAMNNKYIYVFLDGITVDKSATSCIFYLYLMDNIKKCLTKNNIKYVTIQNIDEMHQYGGNAILFIDAFILIHFRLNKNSEINKLLNYKYILIIGENYNPKTNTFIGWYECGVSLFFSENNILYQILKKSYIVTYQNDRTYHEIRKIKNDNELIFFPIDGYIEEYVIEYPVKTKDIDVLFYGHYEAPRRKIILDEISKLPINLVVTSDIFNLNILKFFIDRSKIVFHLNSMDDCYHIPYSKIVKLLINNKIIVTENTDELEKSELVNYVYVFSKDQFVIENKIRTPLYISLIKSILKNYDQIQESINKKNPSIHMAQKYNFEKNLLSLINKNPVHNNSCIDNLDIDNSCIDNLDIDNSCVDNLDIDNLDIDNLDIDNSCVDNLLTDKCNNLDDGVSSIDDCDNI